ncbi:MAG: PglZ domain-containing protein, partial [Actinobacteria bacterium]|nr:PglZ domain-containing protein [Actinomycetota bacterium]
MGAVTEELIRLIAKQVDEKGLVLWFDPERHYVDALDSLSIPDCAILRYEDSYFRLRREAAPYMNGDVPPRLIVYLPVDPADTHDALIEISVAGVSLFPGANPWQRNTRLSVIARRALEPIVGPKGAESAEKQAAAGKLSLAELDRLGEARLASALALILGTANPPDVALEFLSSDQHDRQLVQKKAVSELVEFLSVALDLHLPSQAGPAELREQLARAILATDLVTSLSGQLPRALERLSVPSTLDARETCRSIARTWRLRRDLRDSYAAQAERVQQELGISNIAFTLDQLAGVETFPAIEESLQDSVEASLLKGATTELADMARERQASFWSELRPEIQASWALIATASQLLLLADSVAASLKNAPTDPAAVLAAYTGGDQPWCLLDTYQRHLERRIGAFDFDLGDRHRVLFKLIVRTRQCYSEVGSALAERFLRAYAGTGFRVPGAQLQRELFHAHVQPSLELGKTAYLLVDALRFEMALEIMQSLPEDLSGRLDPALATPPSLTEVGMAALMPKADKAVTLLQVADSKLALEVDGVVLKDRKDRIDFLKSRSGATLYTAKLEDLFPLKKAVRTGIEQAGLVLITSQEIDQLAEGDNVGLARRVMDDMQRELLRAIRLLAELGVQTVVLSADHGYLFGDEIESDMKIDPPGGVTVDLHRRVWVGHGGAANSSYLRARAGDFGLGGDLEIAVPWNFACFKVAGGARSYFHGGLSPQELIVPVAVITAQPRSAAGVGAEFAWGLHPGSKKITSPYFSVQVAGEVAGLFRGTPLRVRIELREKSAVVST